MTVGTIAGQVRIDVRQAIASYVALRAQNAATMTALREGSSTFRTVGLAATAMGVVMVVAFTHAVNAAAEFEKRLDFFGAVSNSTQAEMEAIRKKAIQLGQDTKYSANEIADAFVELGKAGVSAKDILDGVGQAVTNLGAAGDIPLVEASNIITSAIQTYHLAATDAVHVSDLLAGAANASIAEISDLGVTLKYVGGVAAATGISLESTTDAISLLAKAGIRGSTAGTSLRQIIVSLQGNSEKATKQLEKLGIITKDGTNLFVDQTGKIKPLNEIFQILQDHTKGLTQAQQLMAFKTIFNNRALAAAEILTHAGAKGFAEMNKEISKTTAADVAAKRMDNLAGDIEILRGTIETLFIQGGSPLQGFLRNIVQGINGILVAFSKLPEGVQGGIFAFIGVVGVLLTIVGTVALVGSSILKFITIVKLFGPAFSILRVAITGVIALMRALSIAFLTNPIGIVIVAVIALVAAFYLLYTRSTAFRNFINHLGTQIAGVWSAVLDFFSGVPGFFSNLWDSIQRYFTEGLNWIQGHWGLLLAIMGGPLTTIGYLVYTFKDQIIGFFSGMWDSIVSTTEAGYDATVNWFAQLPNQLAYWLGYAIGYMLRSWIDFWVAIYDATVAGGEAAISWLYNLPRMINNLFLQARNFAVAQWTAFWSSIVSFSTRTYNDTVSWFQRLPGMINNLFNQSRAYAVAQWNSFTSSVSSLSQRAYNGVVNWIQRLPAMINNLLRQARGYAAEQWNSFYNTLRDFSIRAYNGVRDGINGIPDLVRGIFNRALDYLSGLISSAYNRAKSMGSSMWEGFKDGMGIHSPSYIEKAMFALSENVTAEAQKTVDQVKRLQTTARGLPTMASTFDKKGYVDGYARSSSSAGAASSTVASTVYQYDTTINNPAPEPASDSWTRTQQKLAYATGGEI